jgi:ribonuclease P protein component
MAAPRRAGDTSAGNRLGVTVSRKVGGAVVRNRLKRRIREWFRRCNDMQAGGFDIVVIGRAPAVELDGTGAQQEMARLTREAIECATA